jgi:hypothetical protein
VLGLVTANDAAIDAKLTPMPSVMILSEAANATIAQS